MKLFKAAGFATQSWGMILLGIWLIAWGLLGFLSVPIPKEVLPLLAIVVGVLILIKR